MLHIALLGVPTAAVSEINLWLAAALLTTFVLCEASAEAQEEDSECTVLCTPELDFEPTLTVENLFASPRVEDVATGVIRRLERESAFEAVLALSVPTELPFLGITLETIFAVSSDDNEPELEAEVNLVFVREEQTGGWVEAHFDVIDKFSPTERPSTDRAYTHKLNLELDVALRVFNWLPPEAWLRNVEVETSLDYVATGLPRRGDVVDGQRFLDDASPWSISFLLVVPVAALDR